MPVKTVQFPTAVGDEDFETIENALRQLPGVLRVEMRQPTKEVTVEWGDPATWRDIHRTVADLGYVPELLP